MPSAEITIERRAVKNARLRVNESGAVLLIVPERFTQAQAESILARKADWIADKRRYFSKHTPPLHRLAPNQLRLFGKVFHFLHTPVLGKKVELDYRERRVLTGLDLANSEIRGRWFRRFAKHYLNTQAQLLAERHRFELRRLYVRAPFKRWEVAVLNATSR